MGKGISVQSRKSKGRRCQQVVRDSIRALLAPYGIVDDDVKSTPMGSSGVDVQLSPAAKRLLDLAVECKAVEALNVTTTFLEHYEKYKYDMGLKLLVHTKNRSPHLVTLRWDDFVLLLKKTLPVHGVSTNEAYTFPLGESIVSVIPQGLVQTRTEAPVEATN